MVYRIINRKPYKNPFKLSICFDYEDIQNNISHRKLAERWIYCWFLHQPPTGAAED